MECEVVVKAWVDCCAVWKTYAKGEGCLEERRILFTIW